MDEGAYGRNCEVNRSLRSRTPSGEWRLEPTSRHVSQLPERERGAGEGRKGGRRHGARGVQREEWQLQGAQGRSRASQSRMEWGCYTVKYRFCVREDRATSNRAHEGQTPDAGHASLHWAPSQGHTVVVGSISGFCRERNRWYGVTPNVYRY